AGTHRGRLFDAPPGQGTRPITDRAKEGIFNMLGSLGGGAGADLLDGAVVVDLFAGSGSFGIESLSRGASRAVFVERDRQALRVLQRNLAALGFDDRATVIAGPVETAVGRLPMADVAFCDPPYADDPWLDLLDRLDTEWLVGHAQSPVPLTERWEELKRRDYGRARIVIARRVVAGGEA
ncbi:MAG: RsmD family RNA methyltransferase, partial [Actinomycetota bacterium]